MEEQVTEALKSLSEKNSIIIEEVKISHGSDASAEIIVDYSQGASGSPSADFLAELSREFSSVIEKLNIFSAGYTVQVSSPGVERQLVADRHWEKAVGRLVKLTLADARVIVARLDGFDPGTREITVRQRKPLRKGIPASYYEVKAMAVEELKGAHVEVEF